MAVALAIVDPPEFVGPTTIKLVVTIAVAQGQSLIADIVIDLSNLSVGQLLTAIKNRVIAWAASASGGQVTLTESQIWVVGLSAAPPGGLFASTANGVSNTKNTTTSLVGAGSGSLQIPANFLNAGRTVRLRAKGFATLTVTSPCTLQFLVKAGALTLCASAAAAPTAAGSNIPWEMDCDVTVRGSGPTGTVIAQGVVRAYPSLAVQNTWGMVSTAVVTADTTATPTLDFQVTQSNNTNAQSVTCANFTAEAVN